MQKKTICKTVHQYNKLPVSKGDMEKLLEIADDYNRVKEYVYERFGGVGSLKKLYPGYSVQNEMTKSGLRQQLNLPSVYFYLAVLDASNDIKVQWTRTKLKISNLIGQNENFSPEEKHYLRFLLKVSNAFIAVLGQEQVEKLPDEIQGQYDRLAGQVETERLHRYLCRQVRKYHNRLHTAPAEGFPAGERAYRYGDHGIYISVKEKRKRIFVPLTDSNQYQSQIYIKLYPEQQNVEIKIPVNVTVHSYEDYINLVGISLGMYTMLTTDGGNQYGENFGRYQTEYADWIRKQTEIYQRNRNSNPGRKKYKAKKRRYEEQLHGYINQELNRFLQSEKPHIIYIPKLPAQQAGGMNKKINNSVTLWQRGYIQRRLAWKCRERSIEVIEVFGKNISSECSCCGMTGIKQKGLFLCQFCGYSAEEKMNTARNAKKRGTGDGGLN